MYAWGAVVCAYIFLGLARCSEDPLMLTLCASLEQWLAYGSVSGMVERRMPGLGLGCFAAGM